MALSSLKQHSGDFWGGLAAMLVALPSAIAFGVTIYSPVGGSHAAGGAIAGMLGAMALGLVAASFGGTSRLITAPCAPAAAVLAAFATEQVQSGTAIESLLLLLTILGLLAGLLQVGFGLLGLGRLIKYMPYPVVSGYLSGVGLIIISGQVPKLLGVPKGTAAGEMLTDPSLWQWQGIIVGLTTMLVMVTADRFTRAVPAAILGLLAGVLAYFALAWVDPGLRQLDGNALVVGALGGGGDGFLDALLGRWQAIGQLGLADVQALLMPAFTLAVLLSIDTLKTCVVLDALTRSRHDSNRELLGQGLGNLASAAIGGVPGAGTMGASLVNFSSGAQGRASGIIEGALALVAFLALGSIISWVPVAALAAILIVVGVRMIDRSSLHFLQSPATLLDFLVIAAVVFVALTTSLIAASGVGIVLAVLLFIREQIGGVVVRRQSCGNETFSKQIRSAEAMAILTERGSECAIFELQGSLFFGTTDQLYSAIDPHLNQRRFLILDLRRVLSVDLTAAHLLEQLAERMAEKRGFLILSHVPQQLPSGMDMQQYFDQVGLVREQSPIRMFGELDEAVEWVEDRILEEAGLKRQEEKPLELADIELFSRRKQRTLADLDACMDRRSFRPGEKLFSLGDTGDELFLIRRGEVRIYLPNASHSQHLATFGRGAFFGEMSFLDGAARSADAVAQTETDVFVLSRRRFDVFTEQHRKVAMALIEGIASSLVSRLRYTDAEMRALES